MYCTNCGRQIPDSARVCGFCGVQLGAAFQQPYQQPVPIIVQTTHAGGLLSGCGGLLNLAFAALAVGVIGMAVLTFLCVMRLPSAFPLITLPAPAADLWSRAVGWQGQTCSSRLSGQPASATGSTGANACNSSKFAYETIPDHTVFKPGEKFTKAWTVRNAGDCAWTTGYTFRFTQGSQLGGPKSLALDREVKPGETYTFKLNLTAPDAPGTYTGRWEIFDAQGSTFGWYSVVIDMVKEGQAPKPKEKKIHYIIYKNISDDKSIYTFSMPVAGYGVGTVIHPGESNKFSLGGEGILPGTYKVKVEWRLIDGTYLDEITYDIKIQTDGQTINLPP